MESAVFPFQELRRGDTTPLRAWLAGGGQIDTPLLGPVAETWTPLMLACAEGNTTLVRDIIETGGARASASVGTKVLASSAPLHVASRYGHAGVAAALLELGAVVDVRDSIGLTPLQYAAGSGYLRTIDALLDAGAEISAEGPGGATALDMAEMAGFVDAVALLRKRALRGEVGASRRKALSSWLESLGCEEFLGRFLRTGYDDLAFMASHGLTEADLDCVGVPGEKLGLRKKLLAMHDVERYLEDPTNEGESGSSTGSTVDAATNSKSDGESGTEEEEEDSSSGESGSSGSDAENSD